MVDFKWVIQVFKVPVTTITSTAMSLAVSIVLWTSDGHQVEAIIFTLCFIYALWVWFLDFKAHLRHLNRLSELKAAGESGWSS